MSMEAARKRERAVWERTAQHASWVMSPHMPKGRRVTPRKLIRFKSDDRCETAAENDTMIAALDGKTAAPAKKAALIAKLNETAARADDAYHKHLAEGAAKRRKDRRRGRGH